MSWYIAFHAAAIYTFGAMLILVRGRSVAQFFMRPPGFPTDIWFDWVGYAIAGILYAVAFSVPAYFAVYGLDAVTEGLKNQETVSGGKAGIVLGAALAGLAVLRIDQSQRD
ncbi:MAG: hypothetical protein ACR2PG_11415 [Hyphomicrobiaceae bacterium]